MDIFENVLNKTKVAFSVAKNKTEEVITVQKKKYNISTLENERNLDLQRLGFIYYKSLKNTDIEDDYIRTLVESIAQKNLEIKEIREEIENIKNKDENFEDETDE